MKSQILNTTVGGREMYNVGMSDISSNSFLSDLSKALRKGIHSAFSISNTILYDRMLVHALVLLYSRLSRSQYRNRDPMGRGADIIEANVAAKLDRPRIASMLAADSNLYILF